MSTQAQIVSAQVLAGNGSLAATIDRIEVGGGTQTVTVDGVAEDRVHRAWTTWHVRLIAPNRMLADVLREEQTYDAAVKVAVEYAGKLDRHVDRLTEIADDLRV